MWNKTNDNIKHDNKNRMENITNDAGLKNHEKVVLVV